MEKQWERQQGEPILWFGRFERYRILGTERNLLSVYNAWRAEVGKGGQKTSIPHAWDINCKRWDWRERAEAWDAEQRRLRMIQEQEALDEMYRQHTQAAIMMRGIGMIKLDDLRQNRKALDEEVSPSDARLLVKDGIEIERTARGLPKEFVEILGMTDDELLARYSQRYAPASPDGSGDDSAGDGDTGTLDK